MNHPALLYYAALLFVGLPATHRSRLAIVCVALGGLSCLAFATGIAGPVAYFALHVAAIVVGWKVRRNLFRCLLVTVLFVDMAMIDCLELAGLFTPSDGWWARYWLVLSQLALFFPDASAGFLRAFRFVSTQRSQGGSLHFASA